MSGLTSLFHLRSKTEDEKAKMEHKKEGESRHYCYNLVFTAYFILLLLRSDALCTEAQSMVERSSEQPELCGGCYTLPPGTVCSVNPWHSAFQSCTIMAARILPSLFTLCSISDTDRRLGKGTWAVPTLSNCLKSWFPQWLPWVHKWNPARCVEFHMNKDSVFHIFRSPLKSLFLQCCSQKQCPISSSFQCEQKQSHPKLIANYLTKQIFCHYLCVTKEESMTLRNKSNAQGHLSQWPFLHLHPWETMLSIILHKSPFGITLTDMQACICRTGVMWQWVTADIWPHHQ